MFRQNLRREMLCLSKHRKCSVTGRANCLAFTPAAPPGRKGLSPTGSSPSHISSMQQHPWVKDTPPPPKAQTGALARRHQHPAPALNHSYWLYVIKPAQTCRTQVTLWHQKAHCPGSKQQGATPVQLHHLPYFGKKWRHTGLTQGQRQLWNLL